MPANTSATFYVDILTDQLVEAAEAFTLEAVVSIPTSGSRQFFQAGNPSPVISKTINDSEVVLLSLVDPYPATDTYTEGSYIDYSLTSDVSIDSSLAGQAFSINVTGVSAEDYTITTQSGLTYDAGDNTYTYSAGDVNHSFRLSIINDGLIENSEELTLSIAEVAGSELKVNNSDFSSVKTIQDTNIMDKITLTLAETPSSSATVNEGSTLTFTLTNEQAIAKGVVGTTIDLGLSTTLESTDYTIRFPESGDVNYDANYDGLLTASGDVLTYVVPSTGTSGVAVPANTSATFYVEILTDNLVEADESFTLEAVVSTPMPGTRQFFQAVNPTPSLTKNINSKDFIDVYLTSDADDIIEAETNSAVAVYWNSPEIDKELLDVVTQSLDVVATLESSTATQSTSSDVNDFSLPGEDIGDFNDLASFELITHTTDASNLAGGSGSALISIHEDDEIEETETINVALTLSSTSHPLSPFIRFIDSSTEDVLDDLKNSYSYSIVDDPEGVEKLTVTSETYLGGFAPEDKTSELIEGGSIRIKLCYPEGKTITATDLSFTMKVADTVTADTSIYKYITTPDDSLSPTNLESGVLVNTDMTGFTLEDGSMCKTAATITTTENTSIQSESFTLQLATSDTRCAGAQCFADAFFTVINNDLTSLVSTGLTQCVEEGVDKRRAVDCTNANVSDPYRHQDAWAKPYPNLAYTLINEDSKPVIKKSTGHSAQFCFQDNATGLIWSNSSQAVNNQSASVTLNDCNLQDKTGSLPTVQELITLLDLNPQSTTKPLIGSNNLLEFLHVGNTFESAHARYWTSTLCGTDKYMTVDMVTGLVACKDATESDDQSLHIKVYK